MSAYGILVDALFLAPKTQLLYDRYEHREDAEFKQACLEVYDLYSSKEAESL